MAVALDADLYQEQLEICERLHQEVRAISNDYERFLGPKARELGNAQVMLARAGQLRVLAAKRDAYREKKGADSD